MSDTNTAELAGINPRVRAIFSGTWKQRDHRSPAAREFRCPRCARWVVLWDHVRTCGVRR